jgi:hypothetical protein
MIRNPKCRKLSRKFSCERCSTGSSMHFRYECCHRRKDPGTLSWDSHSDLSPSNFNKSTEPYRSSQVDNEITPVAAAFVLCAPAGS